MRSGPRNGRAAPAAAFLLACACAFAGTAAAEQRPVVEVTPGEAREFHVAVQRFFDDSEMPDGTRGERLREAIEAGLDFNGVLLPLDRAAYLGPEATTRLVDGPRYDCGDWTQSGADALVEGRIRERAGMVEVEYRVWDTARCVRLLRADLERPRPELHRLGRALADGVVKAFTGMPGASDSEIAFISTRTGQREVFVMDADGSNPRPATRGGSIKAFPDWLPDGRGILYTAYVKDGFPDLFLTSRGSSKSGRILRAVLPGLPKYRGVFSPDGESLAVVASLQGVTDLFRVNRDGRKLRQLTDNKDVIDVAPSWSPDGKRIAFVSDRGGSPQIYVMDADGRNTRRISFTSNYSATPAWSPDGRWIAYGVRAEGKFDIWLTDPEAEVVVPLVAHRRNDASPSWSPDGRKVVFSSDRRGRLDLYAIDVSSGRVQRLTQGARDNTTPVWGPFRE